MDESRKLAEMLCGGDPGKKAASDAMTKLCLSLTPVLFIDWAERQEKPRKSASDLLSHLRSKIMESENAAIEEQRKALESPVGQIFGSMMGDMDDMQRKVEELYNDVFSGFFDAVRQLPEERAE